MPIYDIGEYKGGRVVGRNNVDKVLLWTYQWGWVYETTLQSLLMVKRRPGSEYCKRGLLVKVKPPRGHRPVFVIAPAYQTKALELYEAYTGRSIPYPYPRQAVPFSSMAEHQEYAQIIAINELNKYGGYIRIDRELRDGEQGALPDIAHTHENDIVVWHEVELSAKYDERLFKQLADREIARRRGKFQRLIWWCGTEGIKSNLQWCLAKESIPQIERGNDSKLQRIAGKEGWSPEALNGCSVFRLTKQGMSEYDRDVPALKNNRHIQVMEDF
jgi:hypothetical protein